MLVSFNRADQRTSGPFSSFQCFNDAFLEGVYPNELMNKSQDFALR